ncbi:MAG: PspC domain-containing protein [Lachnospiraceae bacterium]|nr:PspC domain-containing protein [Lachnospiraceae bacterium]
MSNDYKKLTRSSNNKILCGVCGGVGEYLGLDPTVVRLLFILFSFMGGGGILAYFIMAIIMPDE